MAKKISLPVLGRAPSGAAAGRAGAKGAVSSGKPSLDDARSRLGGRSVDESAAPIDLTPGRVVRIAAPNRSDVVGVIVFANASEVHLLVDGTRLRRVTPHDIHAHEGPTPPELAKIASDALLFGRLREGQKVRYADDTGGRLQDGTLMEKCRYGALVARSDGGIVAVGFRKLWPAAPSGTTGEA